MTYVSVEPVRVLGATFWRTHCLSCAETSRRFRTNREAATNARQHTCAKRAGKAPKRLTLAQQAQEL